MRRTGHALLALTAPQESVEAVEEENEAVEEENKVVEEENEAVEEENKHDGGDDASSPAVSHDSVSTPSSSHCLCLQSN